MNQQTWTEQQLEACQKDRDGLNYAVIDQGLLIKSLRADLSAAKAENARLSDALNQAELFRLIYEYEPKNEQEYVQRSIDLKCAHHDWRAKTVVTLKDSHGEAK